MVRDVGTTRDQKCAETTKEKIKTGWNHNRSKRDQKGLKNRSRTIRDKKKNGACNKGSKINGGGAEPQGIKKRHW